MLVSPPPSAVRVVTGAFRVLVVEDDPDSGELVCFCLERAGYRARLAESAEAAIEALSEFSPSVAFIDIGLPDRDGYELMALMRERPAAEHCRFIAVSGYCGAEHERRCAVAGFAGTLTKPISMPELLAIVARAGESEIVAAASRATP